MLLLPPQPPQPGTTLAECLGMCMCSCLRSSRDYFRTRSTWKRWRVRKWLPSSKISGELPLLHLLASQSIPVYKGYMGLTDAPCYGHRNCTRCCEPPYLYCPHSALPLTRHSPGMILPPMYRCRDLRIGAQKKMLLIKQPVNYPTKIIIIYRASCNPGWSQTY